MIQGLIYALISALAFASLPILVKLGYNVGLTSDVMMQSRFVYAVLILLVVIFIKDRSLLKISRMGLLKCAFIGLVIYWLQTTCFVTALATIPASTVVLVLYVHPVTVALLSALFLKMKIDRFVAITLILVIGGCCLVFYDAFLKEVDAIGMAYAVGAMVFFSCYLVLVQVLLKGLKPLTATLYVLLFTGVAFGITGEPSAWLNQDFTTVAICLSLGIFPGVIAVTFLYMSIEKVGSTYACIFSSIEPIATLAAASVFLDENIVMLQIGGAALIILGIIIPNVRALRIKKKFQIAA
ncbi:MAG: DMT family transporter [Pseudodesulfovibrio sp.]